MLAKKIGSLLLLILLIFLQASTLWTQRLWAQDSGDNAQAEPQLIYVFPMGSQRGTVVEVEVQGRDLDETYAVLFGGEGLRAGVKKVEEIVVEPEEGKEEEKKKENDYRVSLQIEIDPAATIGNHFLRLVSPRGISNALQFRVNADPVIGEIKTPHHTPDQAQQVNFPIVINGRISKAGEKDYYGFDVLENEELRFELTPSREAIASTFRAQLALYRVTASWFDPHRAIRLTFSNRRTGEIVPASTSSPGTRVGARTQITLRHRFREAGRYFVEVGSLGGNSAPKYVYQLRGVAAAQPPLSETGQPNWKERSFTRKLEAERLETLWSRTVKIPEKRIEEKRGGPSGLERRPGTDADRTDADLSLRHAGLQILPEQEPNARLSESMEIPVPSIAEGIVERPGDVDTFKFRVDSGQKLAFEIETPAQLPPYFNPILKILDSKGREYLTNLNRKDGSKFKGIYLKWLEPKVVETFKKEGVYYLQMRDITARKGDPSFAYRILIRPQVPHIGDITVESRTRGLEDSKADPYRVNLVPGEAKKVTAIIEQEEGFFRPSNQVAIQVTNLPEGVEAFTGASSYQLPAPASEPKIYKEDRYLPKSQKVTIVLHARVDAPLTRTPVLLSLGARPFVEGKPGPVLLVPEIPLAVVKRAEEAKR